MGNSIWRVLLDKGSLIQQLFSDHFTGNVTWFKHRTKRGVGHNWEGIHLVGWKLTCTMRSIRPCQMLRPWRNSWWVHCYLVLWLFYQITISHTTQQLQLWHLQKQQWTRTTTLLHSLENQITGAQVKRLDALQLSYVHCFAYHRRKPFRDTEFQRILLECRVRSKPLCENLTAVLPKYCWTVRISHFTIWHF